MATLNPIHSNLRLVFINGLNEKGEPIFKRKSYNNVKTTADHDQVYQVAQALGSLSSLSLHMVERDDRTELLP